MNVPHEYYMHRCLALARSGEGYVAPNPMVGAVLVHENRIIGEGYHQQYGQPHAEVNCIADVREEDKQLLTQATLYVSLEPCAHHGKTPPCSDLIIRAGIPKVVIGCRDPFPEVNGKGIQQLEAAGVETITGVLENECKELNKRFFIFHQYHRPYIILKWAQTGDGRISAGGEKRLLISNELTNREVHHWRAAEAAILIGTNTALEDDPSLDNRLWSGKSPVRLVIDLRLRLPVTLKVFNGQQKTIVFNYNKSEEQENLVYYLLKREENILPQILIACYQLGLNSVIVEGGAKLLQSFIDSGTWDEARIITNTALTAGGGLAAPVLPGRSAQHEMIGSDRVDFVFNTF